MGYSFELDLLRPPTDPSSEKVRRKLMRVVSDPAFSVRDVRCTGCFNIFPVLSHHQTELCEFCNSKFQWMRGFVATLDKFPLRKGDNNGDTH